MRRVLDAGSGRLLGLEERLRALEQKASASSRNSSQPPSADAPKTRQQRRAQAREKAKALLKDERSARRAVSRGTRVLVVSCWVKIRCGRSLTITPRSARGAGGSSADSEKVPRHGPGRHQVAELPPTAVFYVEHRTHRLRCPGCDKRTRAGLGIVGESAFGPGLQAAVVALTARNRISRRDMSELLWELFGVRVSVGAIDAICQRTQRAARRPARASQSQVLGAGAINIDETGWFLAGENRTMWTATTEHAAIFRIVEDRHRDRLEELLGRDFARDRDLRPLVGI